MTLVAINDDVFGADGTIDRLMIFVFVVKLVSPPRLFFIIRVWLSLFSSEVSMLADTGPFAPAFSQES